MDRGNKDPEKTDTLYQEYNIYCVERNVLHGYIKYPYVMKCIKYKNLSKGNIPQFQHDPGLGGGACG